MKEWILELLGGLLAFTLVYLAAKIDRKHGHITPYEKRLRKKWEEEKAAEEDAKTEQQQERRHYMSQAEYEQYKREHGIK